MDPEPDGNRPGRNPIRLPEARYQCAGEYCPSPGYAHRSDLLYLDTNVAGPGFFCPVCRPKPMMSDVDQPPTLAEYLANPLPDF